MSYCICFNCGQMVNGYRKYCFNCSGIYQQDEKFWKDEKDAYEMYANTIIKDRELRKDKK